MLDLARRLWTIFIPAFFACAVGIVEALARLNDKWYQNLISISLAILALICLIIGGTALFYDARDTYRKCKKSKEPSKYENHGVSSF